MIAGQLDLKVIKEFRGLLVRLDQLDLLDPLDHKVMLDLRDPLALKG